jgi:7-cyano-7-deazaguanine synthase
VPDFNVSVLLSGGIDSLACARLFQLQGAKLTALHVSYGQAAQDSEFEAALKIASWLPAKFQHVTLTGVLAKDAGLIRSRNAMLLTIALMETTSPSLVAIGIHKGSPYYDCTEGFLNLMQNLYSGYSGGAVRAVAPFLNWTKADILTFCSDQKLPLPLTYSCESGIAGGCGICLSCTELEAHATKAW